MAGMPSSMGAQANSMGNMNGNAQRQYQMRLMAQQAQLRQNGAQGPRPIGGQQSAMSNPMGQQQIGGQMANGQPGTQANPQQLQNQIKQASFLKSCAAHTQQAGRQFNPQPTISGRPVSLYNLFSVTMMVGGSQNADRTGQWPNIANKLGFTQPQFSNAPEELKQIHSMYIAGYERTYIHARNQAKQEQARQQAHQMAGFDPPAQGSPTRTMQPPPQQNQYNQLQQNQQRQQMPQTTPVQANAQIPQNGMSTPQQMMGGAGTIHHRRNSIMRKPDQMTPAPTVTAPSPQQKVQRSPSIKQEAGAAMMKSEEPQSTNYVPQMRSIEWDGGYDVPALFDLGTHISKHMPNMPNLEEMGVIDTRAIILSLASGIHGEVRYALDTLVVLSMGHTSSGQQVSFDLEKCEDLMEVIVDCAEEQVEQLSEDAAEVSDALDLPPYEDIMRGSRAEAEALQEVPAFGTQAYDLDRAADRLIAITTMLRNFSFFEHNHGLLTSTSVVKWLSNTIRLLGTRNMLLRTFYNTQDFYKDMIIFLSNITQSLELPGRDDALHILHFLLAFAPQPSPSYTESDSEIRFTSFVPAAHRYLPPAVDCLAKLLARQEPNRILYKSIFTASSSSLAVSESPLDLLTKAFALSISVLPDRAKGNLPNTQQLRTVDARKAYLTQGMLAADILTSLIPGNDSDLPRAWIESEDGWAAGLLSLASLLSVDWEAAQRPSGGPKREMGWDTESFKLITHRALTMMKRLAERAGRGSRHVLANGFSDGDASIGEHDEDCLAVRKWEGVPQRHALIGALMLAGTDKVALGLLHGLHEMAVQ